MAKPLADLLLKLVYQKPAKFPGYKASNAKAKDDQVKDNVPNTAPPIAPTGGSEDLPGYRS